MPGHTFSYQYDHGITGGNSPTVEVRVGQDSNIDDMVEAFRSYLLACGFSPKTVAAALGDE
jgi:hypothetical protein